MDRSIGKHHTEAYDYLKAVANRLHSSWVKCATFGGRNADLIRDSVKRQCIRQWDEAILKALDANYPIEDISAAICRLKDGKRWLGFLDEMPGRHAA